MMRVLRDIPATPRFSELKQRAIREMAYASVVKIATETRARDWETHGLSGFAKTDTNSEVWSTQWGKLSRRGLLLFYQQGPLADDLDRLSDDARVRRGIAAIEAAFPEAKTDVSRSVAYSWQHDAFARGAFGLVQPGQYYSWYAAAGAAEGRIHFAGEPTGPRASSQVHSPPGSGRDFRQCAEHARQVTLIRKATGQCNLVQRQTSIQQQATGQLHPAIE